MTSLAGKRQDNDQPSQNSRNATRPNELPTPFAVHRCKAGATCNHVGITFARSAVASMENGANNRTFLTLHLARHLILFR